MVLVEIGGTVGDIESPPFLERFVTGGVDIVVNTRRLAHLTLVLHLGGRTA